MKLILKSTIALVVMLGLWHCASTTSTPSIDRPLSPWAFRSVLDQQPRMLTLALHDNLWAAYHTQTGALYKVWEGGVNLDGAVYTTAHGPQPSTLGDAYFENTYKHPWLVSKNGQALETTIQYKGHQFDKGHVQIHYELILPDDAKIQISEQPEYTETKEGLVGLERIFTTSNVPADVTVQLQTNISSIVTADKLKTDGSLTINQEKDRSAKGLVAKDIDALLTLNSNATTSLAATFVAKPLLENENKLVETEEEEQALGLRLINRSDCKTCHNPHIKTIGPAYVDIARKYTNTPANNQLLVSKVKNGGAGVWGEAAMSAHPGLDEVDIKEMVGYIMGMDAEEEKEMLAMAKTKVPEDSDLVSGDDTVKDSDMIPGAIVKAYLSETELKVLADVDWDKPVFEGVIPTIDAEGNDFGPLQEKFGLAIEGYFNIPASTNVVFRLASDDGSRLILNGQEIINNDGWHGTESKDAEMALRKGYHPFRIEFFENGGGQALFLKWRSFDSGEFVTVPATAIVHNKSHSPNAINPFDRGNASPGDKSPLESVHPSYDLAQARPNDFLPKVGGMDFLSDGRMVVSTWDSEGAVYIVEGAQSGEPSKMSTKKIAGGLAEPLGLKVVDDAIYIMQKQELTKLIDNNGDDLIDQYETVCNAWDVTANFHEFGFGLAYKDGHFYAALATGILPGGASALNQPKHRGNAIKISKETGAIEFLATGLRTPNGVGIGVDNEIFIADNQGDWLPSSKIVHVEKGDWFGSRSVDFEGTANLKEKKPVVWLPQDEIGNSPSTPIAIHDGPYKGQMIHGEVTHGGVKRVFVEKVNGAYQGCVFRFIQGLEAGVNRMVYGPDGALYIGGVGSTGNWQHSNKLWYGLQRLEYNEQSTFEMLAVRAKSNGIEIEFTEPLDINDGWDKNDYEIRQWYYLPTKEYGGPKLDDKALDILSVNVSDDRKKVFLELAGMEEDHLIYVHLNKSFVSANNHELWTTEAWYTMNAIPQNLAGTKTTAPAMSAMNTLSAAEKSAGWQSLFDGQTTTGWRNFKKETIGTSWVVKNGELILDSTQKEDGAWQAKDGGDIITDKAYENYELRLEWKIANCGNSGIIYNVNESEDFDYVWQTGPEMQILDNSCHPDAKIKTHRAGDLYDIISCKAETVRPANQWNEVRLIINNGQVEHWLNGKKVVAFEMFTEEWAERISKTKFKDMKGFGTYRKGHISLQDHGDRVAFRNIKIREL